MIVSFQLFANKFLRYKLKNLLSIILLFKVFIFEDRSKFVKTLKFLSLKNFGIQYILNDMEKSKACTTKM